MSRSELVIRGAREHNLAGFDLELEPAQRDVVLYGSDRLEVPFGKHPLESRMAWSGIKAKPRELGYDRGIARVIAETLERNRNANVLRFVRSVPCTACGGSRLSPPARAVQLGGLGMVELLEATATRVAELLTACVESSADPDVAVARALVERIRARAARLDALGLDHLVLARPAPSLSSGEARRLRLAIQLGADLAGLTYVFDEPSAGAHPRDRDRLMALVIELRDRGNGVLVVEHERRFRSRADTVVEIGPEAGRNGERLLYAGPPRSVDRVAPPLRLDDGTRTARRSGSGFLEVRGARARNLRAVDVRFRLGALNVVTGVSGAGKSTLVDRVLARARPGLHVALVGAETVRKLVLVDQDEIDRKARQYGVSRCLPLLRYWTSRNGWKSTDA